MGIGRWVIRFLFCRISESDFSKLYGIARRSFAEEYPSVPKPDHPLSLQQIAIRWSCHDLYGEDMPGVAAELLEAGYDTPSLRKLAGEVNIQSTADAEELVARVFGELSVPYPVSEDRAKKLISRQVSREVIAGERSAWAAASHLEIVIWGWYTSDPRVQRIFELNDEFKWDDKSRRSIEDITDELISIFAEIGARCEDGLLQ